MGFSVNTHLSDKTSNYLTVKMAAKISGYNQQYLRRLLREGILQSNRIGQLWLIDKCGFLKYIRDANRSTDNRFGPK